MSKHQVHTDVLIGAGADRLAGVSEPDDAYLRAVEEENHEQPRRRAMVVIVRDHHHGDDVDRITSELLMVGGFDVDACVTVKSKKSQIRKAIETAVIGGVDLVITIGGTGVGPRDKTPDATETVLDQKVPGLAEVLRARSNSIDAQTSRGVSGVSGSTVVVNLAASAEAVTTGVTTLIPLAHHLIDQLQSHSVEKVR